MSLIKCPHCGAEISEYAHECPHCHQENVDASKIVLINFDNPKESLSSFNDNKHQINKQNNVKYIILAISVCLIVAALIFGSNSSKTKNPDNSINEKDIDDIDNENRINEDSSGKEIVDYLCSKIGILPEPKFTDEELNIISKNDPFPTEGKYSYGTVNNNQNKAIPCLSWEPNSIIMIETTKDKILDILTEFYGEPDIIEEDDKIVYYWENNIGDLSEINYTVKDMNVKSTGDEKMFIFEHVVWIE